jgi:hypothetical protein
MEDVEKANEVSAVSGPSGRFREDSHKKGARQLKVSPQ